MTKRRLDKNAVKSLEGLKLEIGTELGIRWDKVKDAQRSNDREKEHHHNNDQETFNPS